MDAIMDAIMAVPSSETQLKHRINSKELKAIVGKSY